MKPLQTGKYNKNGIEFKQNSLYFSLMMNDPEKIKVVIIDPYHGGSPMSSTIARKVLLTFQPAAEQSRDMENLTKRAREMLELMAKGDRYLV
jgi:hypothetical protein